MMRLPKFEYRSPKTIEEAISIITEAQGDVKIVAGGTDILVAMKQGLITPKYLVGLKKIKGLANIEKGESLEKVESIRIGALSTLTLIVESDVVRKNIPILAKAASCVGMPQLRNAGTLGGNICLNTRCWHYNQSDGYRKCRPVCYKFGGEKDKCQLFPSVKEKNNKCYAVYSGDTAPALIALNAEGKIVGPKGERLIPLTMLFTGDGKNPLALCEGEILTEVIIPKPLTYSSGVYLKYRQREAIDFPLVGVAANIALDSKDGVCESARVVIGAIAPRPVEIDNAEEALKGKKITEDLIDEVGQLAFSKVKPLSNVLGASQNIENTL